MGDKSPEIDNSFINTKHLIIHDDKLKENFTVLLLGSAFVGKSSITSRLLNKGFIELYDQSILNPYTCIRNYDDSLEEDEKKINISDDEEIYDCRENNFKEENNKNSKQEKNKEYIFRLIDTGDYNLFGEDFKGLIKNCNCFLFVYSINNRQSYKNIQNIFKKVKEMNKSLKNMILIGNKSDMNVSRQIPIFEAADFASDNNMKFIETSAKDNLNIHKIFKTFIDVEFKRGDENEEEEIEELCKCF